MARLTALEVLLERDGAAERAARFSATASFTSQQIRLPANVQVYDGFLEWKDWSDERSGNMAELDGDCLWWFLRLADQSNEESFAQFASRYGVLYRAPHGIPGGTPSTRVDPDAEVRISQLHVRGRDGKVRPLDLRERWHREPIEVWRAWARHAKLMLAFGVALRQHERVSPRSFLDRFGIDPGPSDTDRQVDEDSIYLERTNEGRLQLSEYGFTLFWRLSPWRLIGDLEQCESLQGQRKCLVWYLDHFWLPLSDLTLALEWDNARPQVRLDRPITKRGWLAGTHFCLPTITGQLVATILSDRKINLCDTCGAAYPCERRRINGKCPSCRNLARRESKRAWSARSAHKQMSSRLPAPAVEPGATPSSLLRK